MFSLFKSKKGKQIEIFSPVDGTVVDLKETPDEAFAAGFLGSGVAIIPSNGNFVAPIDGELETVFPTGHAYGIKTESGVGVLIHVGIDTVKLEGKNFIAKVKQGQKIKKGDAIAEIDIKAVKNAGYSIHTPIVAVTGTFDGKAVQVVKKGEVKKGDLIFIVK